MEPSYRLRLYLLTTMVVMGFGVLLTRLHEFQIERRDEFLQLVPGNRTETVREPGIRGEIVDRNGITLARNNRQYEVTFNLDEIRLAYLQQREPPPKIQRLKNVAGMTRKSSEKDIVAMVQATTLSVLAQPELNLFRKYSTRDMRTHFLTHGGLVPFSYSRDLTYEEFARFAEHNLDLPGVYVNLRPQREYPYGALACHVIGYLKQWEKGDVSERDTRKFDHYIGDEKGIAGVEATMDDILRGPEGEKSIIKDEKGRTVRMSSYTKPSIGARVQLTLDARAQYLLENTLRLAGRAAGVVMDVNTGEVLAMASVPNYDPNHFIPSISKENFDAYNKNAIVAPFLNRNIAAFTPGSTMKIPTAIAGALEGMASRSFSCDGYVTYGNKQVGCWIWNQKKGRHGSLNLERAIQQSCNPYFNKLANTIGWRAMVNGCQLVGFGKKTNIQLPNESPGILPGSRTWRSNNPSASMTPALTAFLSIGQGDTMVTPLQMCAMTAAIANGGNYFQPRIVKSAVTSDGKFLIEDKPKLEVDLIEAGVKKNDMERIRKGMWMAVNQAGGTAGSLKLPGIEAAAKTGTAQTVDNGKKSNNSWMISFAPYENPKYAMCILVQNAGSGGGVCGPLTNLVYRGLFAQDRGVRLPLQALTEVKGNTNRIEKSIDISPEMIAAVEAGDTSPIDPAQLTIDSPSTSDAVLGETGNEIGADLPAASSTPVAPEMPRPTFTPEIDEEGSVAPTPVAPSPR
ncbi:MAG: penicillin-binding protein 2 [Verrucomicrobia bacterium]|nr:MAG: penicillin-binding protein 2 [Verrucomicrobiota bacterium]